MKKKTKEIFGVKEIARRANVSIGTVDRVIHNRSGVSEKTRNKINEIIQELNYQPNILASRLASKKIYQISILIPRTSAQTNFWEAPLRGIKRAEEEIKQYGVILDVCLFDLESKSSFTRQANAVLKKKPHGVLVSPSFNKEAIEFTRSCHELRIPFVFIDTNLPEQKSLSYIGPDMYYSGYQAAHLIDYGTEKNAKILFLNISNAKNDEQVEKGFVEYFAGHKKNAAIIKYNINQTDHRSVEKSLATIFSEHKDLKAIFVTNSRVYSVAAWLEKKGLKEMLLIGYDILPENITYLEKGIIDFLICHKPEEQGYRGVMALYQTLVMGAQIDALAFMPIDIITRENYKFYSN